MLMDCGAECHQPDSGHTLSSPGQLALAGQPVHSASAGEKENSPFGQGLQVSFLPPVTWPGGHGITLTCCLTLTVASQNDKKVKK